MFISFTNNTPQHFAFGCIKSLFLVHFHYVNNPEATTTGILTATEILQHCTRLCHCSLGKKTFSKFL